MPLAFSCPPEALRRMVDRMGKIVAGKTTVPILANVMLASTEDGRIALTATDNDVTAVALSAPGEATVESEGATTIPKQILGDLVRKAGKGDTLHFASGGQQATIRAGRTTWKLLELPADDFPRMAADDASASFAVAAPQLERIHACCAFAVAKDETRYYLCGIHLHPGTPGGEPGLTAVATDGHRLSMLSQTLDAPLPDFRPVIVPRKTGDLFPLIAEAAGQGSVEIAVSERWISLAAGDLRVVSKLVDGTYPDYRRVLPLGNTRRMSVDREALRNAIDRVQTVSAERGRGMRFHFADGTLGLAMTSPDTGEARDEIAVETGGECEIGFNARYAIEALDSFDTHGLELMVEGPGDPALLRAPGDPSRLVVLMPMRA